MPLSLLLLIKDLREKEFASNYLFSFGTKRPLQGNEPQWTFPTSAISYPTVNYAWFAPDRLHVTPPTRPTLAARISWHSPACPLVPSPRSQLTKTPHGALCTGQQPKFCESHNCCCPRCGGAAWKRVPREPEAASSARAQSKFSVPVETR